MNALKDLLQRCHQRHENPLRQRKTIVTPALYSSISSGLNRLSNKTVVLLTGMLLPDITDRSETHLFRWRGRLRIFSVAWRF